MREIMNGSGYGQLENLTIVKVVYVYIPDFLTCHSRTPPPGNVFLPIKKSYMLFLQEQSYFGSY